MSEKLFRFNPFNIINWTNEEVKEQYSTLEENLMHGDSPSELANDIELYADMGYLIGEMIARYYQDVSVADADLTVKMSNEVYRSRTNYPKVNSDKTPAMSYFENEAKSKYLEEIRHLAVMESNLKRFKYAYESIESKQNALKKKLESLKFDLFNR